MSAKYSNSVGGRLPRLCLKELRETLRDRRTVVTLILMPLLVYPILSMTLNRFLLSSNLKANADFIIGVSTQEEADWIDAVLKDRSSDPPKAVLDVTESEPAGFIVFPLDASDSNSIKPTPNSNADAPNVDGPDAPESRGGYMSFGDHLEQLRSCSILAVAGVFVATTVSMIFAKRILGFILNPLVVIQNAHGLEAQAQAINPPDTFILYLKMAFLAGIVLSMPWTLIQIWRFVALGLFSHERKFLKLITPASIGLFATGAVFMFYIVLPIVLNFFIEFGEAITIDNLEPSWITGVIVGDNDADEPPAPTDTKLDQIAMLAKDPIDPPVGSEWFNSVIGIEGPVAPDARSPVWGSLYDESRRNRYLAWGMPDDVNRLLNDGWNELTVRAEGPRIRILLNGQQTVD